MYHQTIPTYNWPRVSPKIKEKILKRKATIKADQILREIKILLEKVKKEGDKAVRFYTEKFDGVKIKNFLVSEKEIKEGCLKIDRKFSKAVKQAMRNIKRFHQKQLLKKKRVITTPGITCWQEIRPIEKIGLYIPKGLVSTLVMLGIPAKIAGNPQTIICTPPDEKGTISKEILYTAEMLGIRKIYKIGGAQAIGAMAYGTETVPKVDKIFGPGNQYVLAAKMLVSLDASGPAIDLPAGPSEILVVADAQAKPAFVAADLLSQLEHGSDSKAVLVTNNKHFLVKVKKEILRQFSESQNSVLKDNRTDNTRQPTLKNLLCVMVESIEAAITFANLYGPEHLVLNVEKPEKYVSKIKNAGSVFLGQYSAVAAGDYASGPNHILPTGGFARSYSGLSIDSFVKKIFFQKISKEGLQNLAKTVVVLAEAEQMPLHKNAITVRKTLL